MDKCCVLLLALALCGCASPLPDPTADAAWVVLQHSGGSLLMADLLDGKRVADGRYFAVPQGKHELRTRFIFEVRGGGQDGFAQPRQLTCLLLLRYDTFQLGKRYRLAARPWLMGAQSYLYDDSGRQLARGETLRCGPY